MRNRMYREKIYDKRWRDEGRKDDTSRREKHVNRLERSDSIYYKKSPLTSISSRKPSPSILQDKITYHSPRLRERQRVDISRSRSNSVESYYRTPRYYSSKREYTYSPEYLKSQHFHNKHRNSLSSSYENTHEDYRKTFNHLDKRNHRHSPSFSISSNNHFSCKSKYDIDHHSSRFSSREYYKDDFSTSYHGEGSDTTYQSHRDDVYKKNKYANDSKKIRHRYDYDQNLHRKSPFSNEYDESNKEIHILYKSHDSQADFNYKSTRRHEDKYFDYQYDDLDDKNTYSQSAQKSNKQLYDINNAFSRNQKIVDSKENVIKKHDDTVDSHYSENTKQHFTTPIISFKLSNTKNTISAPHADLNSISPNFNDAFYPYHNKIQESKISPTIKNTMNEHKSLKRSLDIHPRSMNNEDISSVLAKKSKKSPENTLIKDTEKNINDFEQDDIQKQNLKDLETVKSISIIKPIAKITMIDSKEGFVYERIGQVGEGTYGKVYKARNRITNELVALKKIRMEYEKNGFPITAMREIKLLQSLKHPNVVCLLEMMIEKSTVYMVFEYMDHDLSGVLSNPNFQFEPSHAKHLCKQMLDGLEYLHHRGVLHRDIKGSNILLDNFGQLKLADFGLARYYHKKRDTADYTNRVITLWFRPPELLLGATAYGPAVDIWSVGCIMIELFTRKPLFPGHDEIHQLELIYDMMGTPTYENWPTVDRLPWYELLKPSEKKVGKFYDHYSSILSPAALSLLSNILALDPSKRPTATDALKHTFFTQEEPKPEPPLGLGNMKGDWHEYESKQRRRKLKAEK